ncbi:hypothetical protein LPJ79_000515 [Coemansia sp. RSA 1821]|nr:hypothetical protein LPJ79_000515 [Coemansia sp. RSA 1821]
MSTTIDDLDFPKAVLMRMIKAALPENIAVQKEARNSVTKAATVFVSYLAAAANDCARDGGHKTIMTNDVFKALEAIGLADFVPQLNIELEAHSQLVKEKKELAAKNKAAGKDTETADEDGEDGIEEAEARHGDSEQPSSVAAAVQTTLPSAVEPTPANAVQTALASTVESAPTASADAEQTNVSSTTTPAPPADTPITENAHSVTAAVTVNTPAQADSANAASTAAPKNDSMDIDDPEAKPCDYGSEKEGAIPEEAAIGTDYIDLGKEFALSFGSSPRSEALPAVSESAMDMTSTSNSSRMAKRPVPRTEKSRYEVVGYPKSTRAPKREPAARDQSSEKRLRQQPSQSRLKGFEIRTIDTHNGKAVVRAPIVAGSAQGADHNDVPELPPLSAAELRYNAQRALISSTAILRTAVANKQAEQRPAKSSRKAGSVWPSAYSRPPPKSLVRAASERAQSLRMAAESKSPGARSRGFQISMQFDSEQPNPAIQQQPPQTVGLAVPSGIDSSALEQGSASVASVLEQWGLSTPAKSASSSKKQPCRSNVLGNDEDSDSAGEDTRRLVEDIVQGRSPTMVASTLGPDTRASLIELSDESQKLIDSIFSGRLSVDSNQRFSRCEGRASISETSSSVLPQPAGIPLGQRGKSLQGPSTQSSPQLQATHTKTTHAPQMRMQEPAERDGSKMRKPSFWSIFRGGTQRKESGDDKKDNSDAASVHSRHHVLRKQQSTSSGFAESLGFSKRQNQNEAKFGTIASSHLFTNKALPSVPSPPLPTLKQQQQPPPADPEVSSLPKELAASATPSAAGTMPSEQAATMAFAPDASMDSVQGGLSSNVQASLNASIDTKQRNSKYYSPMDEFFSVASTDSRQPTADHESESAVEAAKSSQNHFAGDREQGADLTTTVTPQGSPVMDSRPSLKYDSAAAVATVDDSDDDSDVVPLSQSRVLLKVGSEASMQATAEGPCGVEDETANREAVMITDTNDISETGATAVSTSETEEQQPEEAEDTEAAAAAADANSDNSQLARAMGRYLYDIETYYCQYYSTQQERKEEEEPEKPAVLQGIEVPGLVEHAEWLGKREIFNALALRYYIGCFDFSGQRIDECLRRLCSHILLRGESQVIDRLLVALAQRFVECNPDTRLLTADVAHAVTYSALLLNTDLHIADIRALDRMTRSRFVRNTIDTISQFQSAAAGTGDEAVTSPPPQLPELDLSKQSIDSAHGRAMSLADAPLSDAENDMAGRATEPSTLRSLVGSMTSLNMATAGPVSRSSRDVVRLMGGRGKRFSFFESSSSGMGLGGAASASATPVLGSSSSAAASPAVGASPSSLRAFDRLRRKVSTSGTHARSRSGTASMDDTAGRALLACTMPSLTDLTAMLKEVYAGIKSRPLGQPPFARQAHILFESSDPRASVALGSKPEINDSDSMGRPSSARSVPLHAVQRSRSITSMNMHGRPPQHPDLRVDAGRRTGTSVLNLGVRASPSAGSIGGFAAYGSGRSPLENQHIRSGVLVRKHLFERAGKKASHRAWRTCYVSVDRGTVAMYKMDGRHGHPDGRELTDTSLQLGSVSLRHTMTHMLPAPGYSRSRPHVFALQLPSGGVYLFQTASEVELRDWVAACNYWAARESKAPYMIGGVYNMEHGWDNTGDYALRFDEREARAERGEMPTDAEHAADERRVAEERELSRGAVILEWAPPNNPMQRSDLDEPAQLKALLHHISYLEEELVAHKKVQGSIDERFFPRTQQHQRAFSNWERKAQYILQELIKYQSYADVLQRALKQMHDDATPPIPEESPLVGDGASSVATVGAHAAYEEDVGSPNAPGSLRTAGLSGSRASLAASANGGGRRVPEPHTPSKALPIKELLAPASEKAKNRASVAASAAGGNGNGNGSGGSFDERRRGSHPQ